MVKVSKKLAKAGILGGFPVVGVHATVYDGSYHEVDSSEMAFHIAGSLSIQRCYEESSILYLLEPIMKVEVTMPEEYMGDVIGDINSRRGRIEGMEDVGGGTYRSWFCTTCLKCSDILQTYVPELRDVVTTPCSLRNMSKFLRTYRKRFWMLI